MITIEINEEVESNEDMVHLLEEIARSIRSGNTSGVSPSWSLNEEEEVPNEKGSVAVETDDDSDNLLDNESTF